MLSISNVRCEREGRVLFSDLTFDVESGTVLCISGPNGSGKSSLLKLLTGLLPPTLGTVLWDGRAIKPGDPQFLSQLLYIGHKTGVRPALTPTENLKWFSNASFADIETALAVMGLQGFQDFPCENLSKGQCQRVALARLWIQDVPLWILDEPFVALDKAGWGLLQTKLTVHVKRGGIVVVASHHALAISTEIKHIEMKL